MPETGPEIPRVEELVGEEGHHHDRYGRLIAIATVVTTLIGALTAFAQAGSLRTHDRADARAEKYGALALSAAAINRGRAQVQIDRLNLLTQQVRAADNATLFQQYGTASKATQLIANRWNAIAKQTEADTAAIAKAEGIAYICSPSIQHTCPKGNASYSPELDARFPTRYMQQGQWSAYLLTALRDAANQEADDAEAQFVHYAAALTMLAVAVFLFGYSLTPQGRPRRRLYSRVASAFVVIAGGWALFQAVSPVSHPSDAAARAFANGSVEMNVGNYSAAIDDFNQALKLRPRFVDAYFDRAQAEYGVGLPHTGAGDNALPTTAGPVTIPSVEALNRAVEDEKRAHDEGSNSATLLFDLGKNLLYRGLLNHSASDLAASHDFMAQSTVKLNGQDNVSYLTAGAQLRMAEADMALGKQQAANREYRKAEAELLGPDIPRETAVAAAVSDLNLIEMTHPGLTAQAERASLRLVNVGETGASTATGATASGKQTVQFSGISAQPDPGHALWTVTKPGAYDPTKDVLSAQWEYKDPLHGEWVVLPEISGPVQSGGLQRDGATGIASNNASYVSNSSPATCMPPGQYKVNLYVNGQPAGSATGQASWGSLHAVRFSDVDGAICVPDKWVPLPFVGAGTDGYLSPDGSGGTVIFSIPKQAAASIANDLPSLAGVMQSAVGGFSGPGNYLPTLKAISKPIQTSFFMSSSNGQYQLWSYKNGSVISGVGTSANGQIYIGITWGPQNSPLTQQLFLSLSPL